MMNRPKTFLNLIIILFVLCIVSCDTVTDLIGGNNPNPSGIATVTAVIVSPSTATVSRNGTQQFTATVAGTNDPAQTVTWSVSTNTGSVNSTTISASGLLTVGPDQDPATLIIKATSTVDTSKSGTAAVTVPNSNNPPDNGTGTPGLSFSPINSDTTYSVSKGTVTSGAVVIPAAYNGLPVTEIAEKAFLGASNITSVTIPSSITIISDQAFEGCLRITNVIIPVGVLHIDRNAFNSCIGLTSVSIPTSVYSIGEFAFSNCSALTSVTIPAGVSSLGDGAFQDCSRLTSVTIPASVQSLGDGVFYRCISLTSVTIPSSIRSISTSTFSACSALTSVTIPSSVTSIGLAAFNGCTALDSVTIPSSVTSIGEVAFAGCTSLTDITIPVGVTYIGRAAFGLCPSLTSITVKGHANQASADAAWGTDWRDDCSAVITYQG